MSKETMEVFRAAVRASTALKSVSELIPDAIEVHPDISDRLKSYRGEINKSIRVVELIRKERGLQTSGVVAGIRMLQSLGESFENDLVSLGVDKDKHALAQVVERLRCARKGLILQIRVASVGLEKANGAGEITVDTKLVNSTDEAVKGGLGKEFGLEIALFIAKLKRAPDAKTGKILLTDTEYEKLEWQQIKTAHPETKTLTSEAKNRIVCNCLARGQSIQILGPVAVDLWKDIAFIKIEGLVSMDQAIQFGYPVSWEVFRESLDRQEKRIAASRSKG